MRRVLVLIALLTVAGVVPALAADPPSGEVSKANVMARWSGETTNGGATTITAIMAGGTIVCEAPTCDTFALKVIDSDQLTVTANAGTPFTMVEVVKPDGEKIYNSGEETSNSTQVQIPNAPVGDYEVHVALNSLQTATYTAMAVLGPVDSKGRPAAPPSPQPSPDPGNANPQPQPVQPGATLTIKTRKASARRIARKLKVVVEASAPVTDVKATLSKGKKVLGRGAAARIERRAKITVRLKRKLKPGKYTVSVFGKDSGGRTVGASAPLKARR